MKQRILFAAMFAALAATSQLAVAAPVFDTWVGAQPFVTSYAAVATTPKTAVTPPPYLGLPNPAHPGALSAVYSGTSTASVSYVISAGKNPVLGTAHATGVANFSAKVTDGFAQFSGALTGFVTKDVSAAVAAMVLPQVVNVKGVIWQDYVNGTTTFSTTKGAFVGMEGGYTQWHPVRTKDYMPDALSGTFTGAPLVASLLLIPNHPMPSSTFTFTATRK